MNRYIILFIVWVDQIYLNLQTSCFFNKNLNKTNNKGTTFSLKKNKISYILFDVLSIHFIFISIHKHLTARFRLNTKS